MAPRGRQRAAERARDPEAPPPSLGGLVCDWVETFLVHGPGEVQGDPYRLHGDLRLFVWRAYELRRDGHRAHTEAALVLPKGVAKSEAAGALCCVEALGPVRFDGWDANGDPVGRPVTHAEVFVFANDLDQTGNCYDNVAFMLGPDTCSDDLMAEYGEIDIGRSEQSSTRIVLPEHRGSIVPKTSAPSSKEGGKTTFAVLEESHLMVLEGMKRLHRTVRRNARKRPDTWMLHASNFYGPGERSVLEAVHDDHLAGAADLLWFARQPESGMLDEDTPLAELPVRDLRRALKHVYGSAGFVDLEAVLSEIRRPSTPDHEANRFYLNRGRVAKGKWVTRSAWDALRTEQRLSDGDVVALGFDGSRTRDATALVACRLSDRLLQPLAVWEKPHGPEGDGWKVTNGQVHTALELAFGRYDVRLLLADPPHWRDEIDDWRAQWGEDVVVDFLTHTKRMGDALDRFETAFDEGRIRHVGHEQLDRHVLNAEIESTRGGKRLVKPAGIDEDSPRARIDCAVAAVIAHEAAAVAPERPSGPAIYAGFVR
jgi:phage terminase large subunit-like protein